MDRIEGDDQGTAPRGPVLRGSERRWRERRSGLWAAQLENAQGGRRNCLVLDVSSGGAKLRVEQPASLGDIVTLIGERFGTRRGRVVWAANHRVGITFLDKPGDAQVPLPGADPRFLRGRADILRRLARSAAGGDAGAGLLRLAQALEVEANAIEKKRAASPSIRRSPPPKE
jgi:hypothetical protein